MVAFGDTCVTLGAAGSSGLHPALTAFLEPEPVSRLWLFPALFPNMVLSHTEKPQVHRALVCGQQRSA